MRRQVVRHVSRPGGVQMANSITRDAAVVVVGVVVLLTAMEQVVLGANGGGGDSGISCDVCSCHGGVCSNGGECEKTKVKR
ncbi:hypothetical protein E2C01_087876 [Portunus trituberculatus]|uniref:Uncharacterized protein n=1 Tax=Portunus trituberculatus TaxID=210409 RepID=A0A5B7J4N9_PORTR|nr:hypothetical protein [Portunus trituberculatus]